MSRRRGQLGGDVALGVLAAWTEGSEMPPALHEIDPGASQGLDVMLAEGEHRVVPVDDPWSGSERLEGAGRRGSPAAGPDR